MTPSPFLATCELAWGIIPVHKFIAIARANDLRHLTCMLISDLETDAVLTLRWLHHPRLRHRPAGNQHDMLKIALKL